MLGGGPNHPRPNTGDEVGSFTTTVVGSVGLLAISNGKNAGAFTPSNVAVLVKFRAWSQWRHPFSEGAFSEGGF